MAALRITVAGKGGVGKTVISAVLARQLAQRGHRVLAVDCDDNPMLAISLGADTAAVAARPPIPTDFWTAVERAGEGRAAVLVEDAQLLIARHGIAAPDGVTLLGAPVVENDGCSSDARVRGMLGVLLGYGFDRVITDFEAGVDEPATSLGGLLNPADILLVVATPSPVALGTAKLIATIGRDAGVAALYGVANQVRSAVEARTMADEFAVMGLECIATIPSDPAIAAADAAGTSPLDGDPRSPALEALRGLAKRLGAGMAEAAR
jgi:CO dehydrogenase maturation factor